MNEIVKYTFDDKKIYHKDCVDPIESVGWESKGCFYFTHMFDFIAIPDDGYVVQIGCTFGCSLQILYEKFPDRTWGIDPFNPLKHPRVIEKKIQDMEDFDIAFVHCDAGDFRDTPELRKFALDFSLRNLVEGGVCLTSGYNDRVDGLLGWKMEEFVKDYDCGVEQIPQELKALTDKKFTTSDCIITKW